jgi:hypothetical protein
MTVTLSHDTDADGEKTDPGMSGRGWPGGGGRRSRCDQGVLRYGAPVTNEYTATFDLIDADGDGFIDTGELRNLMRALGQEASTSRVVEFMVGADLSQDGKLTLEEFTALMRRV